MDYYDYCDHSVNIEEATKEYETSVYKYKGVITFPFIRPCIFIVFCVCVRSWFPTITL